jgi:hypothetical protein
MTIGGGMGWIVGRGGRRGGVTFETVRANGLPEGIGCGWNRTHTGGDMTMAKLGTGILALTLALLTSVQAQAGGTRKIKIVMDQSSSQSEPSEIG